MIYEHGSFQHNVHVLDVSHVPEWNALGQLVRTTKRIVIQGKVEGNNQAELKTAILALENAYLATQVTRSGLLHSDESTDSAHHIDTTSEDTERGIGARLRWLDAPAQYVTHRRYLIVVEAAILGPGATEVEFNNRIIRIGDGSAPRVVRNTQSGVIIQNPYPASVFRGIETGRKVSRIGTVLVQAPTFPSLLDGERSHQDAGSARGPDGVWRYFATWTYQYLSESAF